MILVIECLVLAEHGHTTTWWQFLLVWGILLLSLRLWDDEVKLWNPYEA
jgi:hypothetical protein